jgi:hypothetical protein
VEVNLLGFAEHPVLGDSPYRVSADGVPYVPVGDGGIVLGLRLGDSVFTAAADHAAPGACLTHPDEAARQALVLYSCIGNEALVRTGAATGAAGAVIGKRGESGRVIAAFRPGDLARMRPGDQVSVRSRGQGLRPDGWPAEVAVLNIDPGLLARLPVSAGQDDAAAAQDDAAAGQQAACLTVSVRMVVPARLAGNGLGRPAHGWCLDLQLATGSTGADLLLGDLVAVTDLDVRYNMGYRRDWLTIGVTGHGSSPLPGHGPGITPILCGPRRLLRARPDGAGHIGLTESALGLQ